MSETRLLTADQITLIADDPHDLRLILSSECCYWGIGFRCIFPKREPNRFVAVLDSGGDEIGVIEDLAQLSAEVREIVATSLRRHYFVPRISDIAAIDHEGGLYHWDVDTDRGRRDFSVQGRTDHIKRRRDGRLIITDTGGCTYEIAAVKSLPDGAQKLLLKVL
jgi:hypothetical protein